MEYLGDKGVAFEEKDVVANPQHMEELLVHTEGVRGTPVIVIDGEVFRGFDRGRIARTLGLA